MQSPAAEEPSKPLPPTHPLTTGQHSQPQEAVPQNHDAQPGPPAASAAQGSKLAPMDTADLMREHQKQTETKHLGTMDGAKEESAPVMQTTDPLAPPPTVPQTAEIAVPAEHNDALATAPTKTDSAISAMKVDEPTGMAVYNS